MNHTMNGVDDIDAIKKGLEEALRKFGINMQEYNRMTIVEQQPNTRYEWVDLLRAHAIAKRRIYNDNTQLFERMYELCNKRYQKDVEDYNDDIKFSDLERLGHHNVFFFFFNLIVNRNLFEKHGGRMPFLWKDMISTFSADIEARMPHSELALISHSLHMGMNYQIAMLGNASALEPMQRYAQKVLEFEDRYDTFSDEKVKLRFLKAYFFLLFVDFQTADSLGFDVAVSAWNRFNAFCHNHPGAFDFKDLRLQLMANGILRQLETFIPMLAFTYFDQVDDDRKAWIHDHLREFVSRYDTSRPETYHFYARAKKALDDWSANEAFEIADRYYKSLDLDSLKKDTVYEVSMTFQVCKSMMYLLNKTTYAAEVKASRTYLSINHIIDSIRRCNNKNFGFEISHHVYSFLSDKTINGLLTSRMRIMFIDGVLKNTMMRTYAHSIMVTRISEALLQAVFTFEPQLLIGTMGIKSEEEVYDRRYELNEYIINAAKIHDLGKLSMIQLINNTFVKLREGAFQTIKLHPWLGLFITNVDPSFQKYRDAVLRHHLWYNRKGGYPLEVAHEQTPYDLLINIIQIADSLEAGSDFLGRSYKKRKTYRDLLAELKAEAGTRYNPDLVRLMSENVVVYNTMEHLLVYSMEENYFNIYMDFIGK